jgi:Methylamine utilisation protein MauE
MSAANAAQRPAGFTADRWLPSLGALGGLGLGAVLLVAAWGKALDPLAFAEEIRRQGLEVGLAAPHLALLVVTLEATLGAALCLNLRRAWVLGPATALVALFVFLNGRTYWLASHGAFDVASSCGCFGSLWVRTPAQAFWQDLLLLLPPLGLAFLGRGGAGRRWWRGRLAVVAAVGVVALLFAWRSPHLPLDDLATRLKPGVAVESLCAGGAGEGAVEICLDGMVPELESGWHLAVIAAVTDERLRRAVGELNAIAAQPDGPRVWLLTASTDEERTAFYWQAGPAFEIREIPEALLRPLYRTLPRSFLVRDGRVEATFTGIPGAAALGAQ